MAVNIEKISEDEIKKAVSQNLATKKFTLKDFQVVPASDNPLGFLGDHERIKININVGGEDKTLHYFCKKVPTKSLAHYDYAQKAGAFYKEIELFKTVFDDFANAKTVKTKKWLPEFYYSRGTELLILEDLSVQGFYMYPERTPLDFEHAQVAIDAIARMHAASFIFEEKINAGKVKTHSSKYTPGKKTDISELYPNLMFETETSDIKGHPGNTFWNVGIRSELAIIDLLPDYTPEQRNTIRKNMGEKLKLVFGFVKPSKKFRNAQLHGDLWANNMLFCKDSSGKVTDTIIIDFQLGRYGPPAHDLMMFLYLSETRSFRQENEKNLLNQYYNTLTNELRDEGFDVSNILPRQEFDESITYYREYAILNNIVYFQMILNPSDLMGKFLGSDEMFKKNMYEDRSELIVACYKEDELVRARVTEGIREMAEFYNWV